MVQLGEYIIALTNLYGLVQKSKVVEIYNSQNKNQISLSDIDALLEEPPEVLEDAFLLEHKDYFVNESIMDNGEFDFMLSQQGDKPRYVPKKSELLKYVDESYFEKTKQYNDLLKYAKKNLCSRIDDVEGLCDDIHGVCQFGADMGMIFDTFEYHHVEIKTEEQVNQVVSLVTELANNTRIWENKGHTPYEIFEKFEKPNLGQLPVKPFELGAAIFKKEKIGRNDTCPCGSGKKYKKCCLGK